MCAARLRSKEPNSRLGKASSQAETAALCHRCGMLRGRETTTYLFRLVLLHANCVKKPHRSSTMVTFFALLAHKITSSTLSNLLLRDP